MATEQTNPFDMVQELNRAMYGDPASRSPGLYDKIDALTQRLDKLDQKLEVIEKIVRKPSAAKWTIGYIAFCVGGIFAVIAMLNQIPHHQVLGITPEMAAAVAVVLGAIALYFFLTGFGWLNH